MLHSTFYVLFWTCVAQYVLAGAFFRGIPRSVQHTSIQSIVETARDTTSRSTSSRATAIDIVNARKIVNDAISKMSILNKARLDSPMRNQYRPKPGTQLKRRSLETEPPPLLNITRDIADAAALIAELESTANSNLTQFLEKRAGRFWMEGIARKGTVPWENDSGYKVSTISASLIAVYTH